MAGMRCSRRQRTGTEVSLSAAIGRAWKTSSAGVQQHGHGRARRGLADADEAVVGGELADGARDRAALGGDARRVVVGRQPEVDELACRLWVHGAGAYAAPRQAATARSRPARLAA